MFLNIFPQDMKNCGKTKSIEISLFLLLRTNVSQYFEPGQHAPQTTSYCLFVCFFLNSIRPNMCERMCEQVYLRHMLASLSTSVSMCSCSSPGLSSTWQMGQIGAWLSYRDIFFLPGDKIGRKTKVRTSGCVRDKHESCG